MVRFKDLYNEVFDAEGNIKSCGRAKTKELIEEAESIKAGVDFGNTETGFMNVDNIKKLYKEL